MKRRFSEEQIIGILKQHEGGMKTLDVCREHGISQNMFYTWKSKFGGMSVAEAQRLKSLETENAKLKRLLADAMLDKGSEGSLKKLVKPAARKVAAAHLQKQHCYSQRRACHLTNCKRKSAHHVSQRGDDAALRADLKRLAEKKTAWGYRLLHGALQNTETKTYEDPHLLQNLQFRTQAYASCGWRFANSNISVLPSSCPSSLRTVKLAVS